MTCDTYRSFGLLIYLFHLATYYKYISIPKDILLNVLPNGTYSPVIWMYCNPLQLDIKSITMFSVIYEALMDISIWKSLNFFLIVLRTTSWKFSLSLTYIPTFDLRQSSSSSLDSFYLGVISIKQFHKYRCKI